MSIPKLEFSNRDREWNLYTGKQRLSVIKGWLFEGLKTSDMDKDFLGLSEDNPKGFQSMNILHYVGLTQDHQGLFDEGVDKAIEEIKKEDDPSFSELLNILEDIKFEEEFINDKEELTLDDSLEIIRHVFRKQDFSIGDGDYEALIVKKLPAADIINFNKPKYKKNTSEEYKGKTTHIAFTTTLRNMFPYLRIEGFDDENKKDYLRNFFVINIPIFLNNLNLSYLLKNYQKEKIRGTDIENQLSEIKEEMGKLNPNENTIKTHSTVFIFEKDKDKDQIALSQTNNDGNSFRLLRKLLFENDFFIILKHKKLFQYDVYGLKNKDGNLLSYLEGNFFTSYTSNKPSTPVCIEDFKNIQFSPNRIFFGAPGTGKSYSLNQQKNIIIGDNKHYERVTFHPDYSYANFVGTYKPIKEKNKETGKEEITYKFVPGPFLRVFVNAMKNQKEAKENEAELKIFLLIIEEINRANVSAVFGDIFQLLDRDENNQSEYSINVSEDIKNYLSEEFKEDYKKYFPNNEIKIPNNMFIWATMNSADQGVFPIDTAFKRRWDFEYISINNNYELIKNLEIESKEEIYNWNEVRTAINNYLLNEGINEDKLMGPFFIKENSYKDFTQLFKDKVLMYLYEDAAKPIRDRLFKGSKEKLSSFSYLDICNDFQDRGVQIFNTDIVNEIKTIIKKEKTSESTLENNHSEEEE